MLAQHWLEKSQTKEEETVDVETPEPGEFIN